MNQENDRQPSRQEPEYTWSEYDRILRNEPTQHNQRDVEILRDAVTWLDGQGGSQNMGDPIATIQSVDGVHPGRQGIFFGSEPGYARGATGLAKLHGLQLIDHADSATYQDRIPVISEDRIVLDDNQLDRMPSDRVRRMAQNALRLMKDHEYSSDHGDEDSNIAN